MFSHLGHFILLLITLQEYLGPEIVSHFGMHGASVAEIIKNFFNVLKKRDEDISDIILEALKRVCLDFQLDFFDS